MFDFIDEQLFADTVYDQFSVLDERYVQDCCKELLPCLNATFEALFDIRCILIDSESGKPVSRFAIFDTFKAAEEAQRMFEGQKLDVGYLLTQK